MCFINTSSRVTVKLNRNYKQLRLKASFVCLYNIFQFLVFLVYIFIYFLCFFKRFIPRITTDIFCYLKYTNVDCSLIMMSHQIYVIPFTSGIGEPFGLGFSYIVTRPRRVNNKQISNLLNKCYFIHADFPIVDIQVVFTWIICEFPWISSFLYFQLEQLEEAYGGIHLKYGQKYLKITNLVLVILILNNSSCFVTALLNIVQLVI
uniref:Uncharacterized protein n=1 Tax=Heterorhabditis bacteriophora TaxID=37862 RepID=A0A1I7WAG2_HETBA